MLRFARCMSGYEPRKVTAQDCSVLCNLASMVVKEMQKDQLLLERESSGQVLQRRNSKLNVGCIAYTTTGPADNVLSAVSLLSMKHTGS